MPKYAIEVEKTIMKKFVSSIITITLLLSNQSFAFAEENDSNDYSSNLSAMIQKYDADNYFSTMSVSVYSYDDFYNKSYTAINVD